MLPLMPATDRRSLTRALVRLAAGGTVAAMMVAGIGLILERRWIGESDAELVARTAEELRAHFDQQQALLDAIASTLAARPERVAAAAANDGDAVMALFADARRALAGEDEAALGVTIYRDDGTPLAWSGRPSELPRDRLSGSAALFIAPGPLGLRLVHLRPLLDVSSDPRRIGAVAVERLLSPIDAARQAAFDAAQIETRVLTVTVQRLFDEPAKPDPSTFVLRARSGAPLLEARVTPDAMQRVRADWRRGILATALAVWAVTILLAIGPMLERRALTREAADYLTATIAIAACVLVARALLFAATPVDASPGGLFAPIVSPPTTFGRLLRTPVDLVLSALTLVALAGLAGGAVTAARRARRRGRGDPFQNRDLMARFVRTQLVAAASAAMLVCGYELFLREIIEHTSVDVLHFSFHPWDPARLAFAAGLVLCHAGVIWTAVLLLRVAVLRWRLPRSDLRPIATTIGLWAVPFAAALALARVVGWPIPADATWLAAACAMAAYFTPRAAARYSRASQAGRLLALFLLLVIPSLIMYRALFEYADVALQRMVDTQYAPQAMNQRDDLKLRVKRSLEQIDQRPRLAELLSAAGPVRSGPPPTEAAFFLWAQTDLARYRLTSAIELYSGDGTLVSRFALNLPEYTATAQRSTERGCDWNLFEEVSPFGSEERILLHAGRGICDGSSGAADSMVGSIVLHAMLDFNTLPFISSQSPYFQLVRPNDAAPREGLAGRDIDFVVYGWSRRPIYTSGATAWLLDEATFGRTVESRAPFWTTLAQEGRRYRVRLSNDRAGIYALGYPLTGAFGHLINVAELVALVFAVYVVLLAGNGLFSVLVRRKPITGRDLLREIRASFYRKLFLAFVGASVVPVLVMAVVARAYMTARLLADVEASAIRTASIAQRVIEDYARLQERAEGVLLTLDDDLMLWISRVITQDVNIFDGPRLVATSERDLFASGLLPTRTPADVFLAIAMSRRATFVGEERVGDVSYTLAAAPITAGGREAILTVPLTLRQQEIEREIDDLNRRIVLAVLVFILMGAGIGYWSAERIADPINRLRRATGRIARGDLDVRVALTSTDELRRLMEAFNSMATELQRQRSELERTNRLAAWADMARQVAHEIKNPLTPIQLSAEHLRRVHVDRGGPLSPVLEGCIDAILSQVRLLRQIATEFSSFASSPTPRPAPTVLADLVHEVVEPYRAGLGDRVAITEDVPRDLPAVLVDPVLFGRALTNIVENAVHAMPGGGSLSVRGYEQVSAADQTAREVVIVIRDTGVGLDPAALSRIFEPYFSTKAIGTGLGLTIAKRNVELHGGTIAVESRRGEGAMVTIVVPLGS
jgi:signal transduction histidine kinase